MYHVYTEKDHSELSRVLVVETDDFEVALEKAEKAIDGKEGYNYVIEKTDGSFNSYGDLIAEVVAQS